MKLNNIFGWLSNYLLDVIFTPDEVMRNPTPSKENFKGFSLFIDEDRTVEARICDVLSRKDPYDKDTIYEIRGMITQMLGETAPLTNS